MIPRDQPRPANPTIPAGSGDVPQTHLQDVLPELNDLSQKVGGLEHLAEIVESLRQANE